MTNSHAYILIQYSVRALRKIQHTGKSRPSSATDVATTIVVCQPPEDTETMKSMMLTKVALSISEHPDSFLLRLQGHTPDL